MVALYTPFPSCVNRIGGVMRLMSFRTNRAVTFAPWAAPPVTPENFILNSIVIPPCGGVGVGVNVGVGEIVGVGVGVLHGPRCPINSWFANKAGEPTVRQNFSPKSGSAEILLFTPVKSGIVP